MVTLVLTISENHLGLQVLSPFDHSVSLEQLAKIERYIRGHNMDATTGYAEGLIGEPVHFRIEVQ